MICFLVLICMMLISGDALSSNNTDYRDCPNDFTMLEKALYDIKGNKANLTKIFYLPQKHPLEFVRVHYFFQNMTSGINDNCSVEYLWASEGFLLIQPPSVFQFSSLFFGNANDKYENVRITLPLECLPAVGDNCSCYSSSRDNLMALLTQQLKLYAKYHSPDRVVQDDTTMVKALCSSKLRRTYYDPDLDNSDGYSVFMFFMFALMIPLISIILMAALARSWQKVIHVKITRASNSANVAALVITGFFVTLFITSLDLASVFYAYTRETELDVSLIHSEPNRSALYIKKHTLNLLITIILTIYDGTIFLTFSLFPLIYICIIELKCGRNRCFDFFLMISKWLCTPCFFTIFGTRNHNDSWKLHNYDVPRDPNEEYVELDCKKIANNRLMWLFMHTTTAPAFSLAGHLGFILISWIINPAQATAIFIQYIVILVFLYVLARQCYLIHWKFSTNINCCCLLLWPVYDVLRVICCIDICRRGCIIDNTSHSMAAELQPITGYSFKNYGSSLKVNTKRSSSFNSKAFCIAFAWSWSLVALTGFAVLAFFELPVATLFLPNYLLNIFQILLIILPLLITYKILSTSETEVLKFMRNMRLSYMAGGGGELKIKNWSECDDIEAVGDLAGRAVYKYVNPGNNNLRNNNLQRSYP